MDNEITDERRHFREGLSEKLTFELRWKNEKNQLCK